MTLEEINRRLASYEKKRSGLQVKLKALDALIVELLDQKNKIEHPDSIKFSEAIRRGAKLRRQCANVYHIGSLSCVLGAAYEGIGEKLDQVSEFEIEEVLHKRFPFLVFPTSSETEIQDTDLVDEIIDRNDSGMTREDIADWLESIGY